MRGLVLSPSSPPCRRRCPGGRGSRLMQGLVLSPSWSPRSRRRRGGRGSRLVQGVALSPSWSPCSIPRRGRTTAGGVRPLPLSSRRSIHGGPVNLSVSDGAYSISIGMVHATVGIRARETAGGEADSHGRMDHPKTSSHQKVNVPSTSRGRTGPSKPVLDRAKRPTVPELDQAVSGLTLQSIRTPVPREMERRVAGPGLMSRSIRTPVPLLWMDARIVLGARSTLGSPSGAPCPVWSPRAEDDPRAGHRDRRNLPSGSVP
jgi:hypothetical protein